MKKRGEGRKWRRDDVERTKLTISVDEDAVAMAKVRGANISQEAEEAIKSRNKAFLEDVKKKSRRA